jgi:hypothetical protein
VLLMASASGGVGLRLEVRKRGMNGRHDRCVHRLLQRGRKGVLAWGDGVLRVAGVGMRCVEESTWGAASACVKVAVCEGSCVSVRVCAVTVRCVCACREVCVCVP